jgi:hypothetical protein
MSRKNTTRGLLADRPNPIAATNTYYFTTDAGSNHYYYSDGTVWRLQDPDFTDIDPSTDAVVSCGVSPAGAIEPFKVTNEGYQRIAGTIGPALSFGGEIIEADVSQQIIPANTERKFLLVQNTSDKDMYVGIGEDPTEPGKGLLLAKNGGSLICDLFIPTQAINIYCNTDGKTFVCLEG